MRILAVHRYFWPDTPPYASFLRRITERWAEDGHSVEVLTAQPSYSASSKVSCRPTKERIGEVEVTRVPVISEQGRLPGQLLNMFVFPAQIAWKILTGPRRDLVMCSTAPQVTLGFAVSAASRLRGSNFVYHCMDLHPEIGRLSGDFANPLAFKILAGMDLITMRRADKIVVLSSDMKAAVVARDLTLASKVQVLNNLALPEDSTSAPPPLDRPANVTLRIVFTGNIGRFQGLETAIDAVKGLSRGPQVELIFMGEGKAKESLIAAARGVNAEPDRKIHFLPHGSAAQAKALMRTADLGLVSLAPEVVKYAYPSKTATYLVEELPVLVVCDAGSELARTVQDHGLGLSVPTNDVHAMIEAIEFARDQLAAETGTRWRDRARDYASREFDEQRILDRWTMLAKAYTNKKGSI